MRNRNFFISTIVVSLILFAIPDTIAQSGPNNSERLVDPGGKGTVQGMVTEARSGVPMEYSSVAVYRAADSSLVTGTVTDQTGKFIISNLPFGKYYLVVNFVGYNHSKLDPVILGPDNRQLNVGQIKLSVNTKDLGEVEVVADQRRVEYKIDKKVVNVSEDLNAAGGTAVDVLENTPSVTVDIEGNVTLRGSGSFTVLINGKPTVLEGSDALRQIPASTIQNIEIITNPSVKYDPDGNAGIINVILKKQVESGTTGILNASAGWNNKYKFDALVNRRAGKTSFFLGGNYDNNLYAGSLQREHITYADTDTYNMATGDFNFMRKGYRVKGGVEYDINPRGSISLEADGGSYGFGIDRSNTSHEYTIPATTDAYYLNKDVMNRDGNYYGANFNYSQSFDTTAHKIQVMANFSNRNGDEIEDLEYTPTDENYQLLDTELSEKSRNLETGNDYEYRIQVDYSRPLKNGGMLETGYQGRFDDQLEYYTFQEYDPDNDQWISIDENSSAIDYFRNVQGAYVQYRGNLKKLQYQVGIRGEYTYRNINYENFNNSYNINRFDYYPTIHLSREFGNDNQLMASYSKRVDRPRGYYLDSIPSYIDKQTVRIGNPRLEPEYVNSFELGYQKGWGKNFAAFELYYRNTNNLITRVTQFDSINGIFYQRFENIKQDHNIGSEIMVNWQLVKWLNMNASIDGYYYRIQGELFGERIDNSSFNYDANLNTTFSIGKFSRIQANIGYRGPSVTAQGSAEGFVFVNLAARQDFFNRKLSATLQVRDLLGTMKRDFTASGPGFEQHVIMQREPRVVMLTLSYKINNYRVDQQNRDQMNNSGMEMDSGF